jgi:hypothetical protein
LDLDENEWWALGQHYGLATPLLDWTDSPYAAAFFAFEPEEESGTSHRAIFGLEAGGIPSRSREIAENERHGKRWGVEVIRPLNHHDIRLVSQAGLFSKAPTGLDLTAWVQRYFHGSKYRRLVKILIPSRERIVALNTLNRMNINHLSLFPDLTGSARFCNTAASVLDYVRPEGRIAEREQQEDLDSIEPPSISLRARGRPIDAQQLRGIAHTNRRLLSIEKIRCEASGQDRMYGVDVPARFEWLVSKLADAGLTHTNDVEDAILSLDAERCAAIYSEFGGSSTVNKEDGLQLLAVAHAAKTMNRDAFEAYRTKHGFTPETKKKEPLYERLRLLQLSAARPPSSEAIGLEGKNETK